MGHFRLNKLLSFVDKRRVFFGCRCIAVVHNVLHCSSLNASSPVRIAYDHTDASSDGEDLPPLVILHGLFGSKTNWRTLAKRFHKDTGRKILTIDARNHGESEHSTEMNYHVQALDVCNLFQELELPKAVVMGHSMGGKTAMTLALSHPEYVHSLIVVDMSPTKQTLDDDIPRYLTAKRNMNLNLVKNKQDAERLLMDVVPNAFLRSFFLTNLVKGETGFKWRINLEAIENNISEVSGFPTQFPHQKYNGRTLFIGGSRSDYIQAEEFAGIQKLFPRADLKFIPDSGHWPHAEKPLEFAKTVTEFLDECLQDHNEFQDEN
ncbi:sn-1-specific diacylglycerol lipase ABHD11-like [Montipora capricornis]|uniref:sn-1-specific diacylglycerol lipase ABHD11-like n=1 Tax=Montipora foliosa TaxID=591990 RepID=UPI0035F17139